MGDAQPPGRLATLFQVVVCCGQIPTQTPIVAALLLAGMTPYENDQVTLSFFVALTLLDTALVVLLMLAFITAGGERWQDVFYGPRPPRTDVGLGIILIPAALILGIGLVAAIRTWLPWLHNVPESPFDAFVRTPGRAVLFTIVVIIAGGVREELQRGFLLHRFGQRLGGVWVGLAVFSVLFGLAHAEQGWDVAVATGVLGLGWGLLYIRRRSVTAAMVSHAGFNATQVLQQVVLKLVS